MFICLFLLEVKNLRKFFGKYEAVAGISFTINEGEVFGLLGPNGAVKTTTIRMITTLLPPTSGEIKIEGINVIKNGGYIRNLIGYVPQALSADSTLTGYENLLIVAKLLRLPKKEREERINHILDILNLSEAANRIVKEYSGGMVRKLEIGQALIHKSSELYCRTFKRIFIK